jgi:glycosyltransferase involved in cell wall biosynthesis
MATAVIDLEFEHLPPGITGIERYHQALLLVRFRGQPVGQITVPVLNGCISSVDLRHAVVQAGGWLLWEAWLHKTIEWDPFRSAQQTLPSATVAVCTRDRPDDLRRCLDALAKMHDDGQEILVIDNCPSSDATLHIVETYSRIRYVRENSPGLDCARNCALREAKHEIVAFVDDDAVPDCGWLRALLRNFDDPLVLCVTGLTMPLELETEAQEGHEQRYKFSRGFKRRVFESTNCEPMASGHVGAGVNMALRRCVLEELGPFDEALDAGTVTCSGGDNEMFARILSCGYRIVYEPHALSWHRHRRSWKELRRLAYGSGAGVYAAWTRSLLIDGEIAVFKPAVSWFLHKQLPELLRALLGRPKFKASLELTLLELLGCIAGPKLYLSARRKLRQRKGSA